jgi:hypothetical protein
MLGRVAALLIRDLDRSRVIFLALARGQELIVRSVIVSYFWEVWDSPSDLFYFCCKAEELAHKLSVGLLLMNLHNYVKKVYVFFYPILPPQPTAPAHDPFDASTSPVYIVFPLPRCRLGMLLPLLFTCHTSFCHCKNYCVVPMLFWVLVFCCAKD